MKARTTLVALAVAATLTSVAAAGPGAAAKQRVVIDSRIYPGEDVPVRPAAERRLSSATPAP